MDSRILELLLGKGSFRLSRTLVLKVLHGNELDIEYAKKEIMDKINTFFGYECITQIKLKIAHEKIHKKQNKCSAIKDLSKAISIDPNYLDAYRRRASLRDLNIDIEKVSP